MKITEIKEYTRKSDSKKYWRVALEGDEIPLLTFNEPTFEVGAELSKDSMKLMGKEGSQYYGFAKKEERPQTTKQPYGKHSEKDSETESSKRCALMQATELYNYSRDSGTPFDKEQFIDISKVCKHELGLDSPLVAAIKKEGGVEE